MKLRVTRRRLLVGSIVATVLIGGGVAFAFFTASGTGTGVANTGKATTSLKIKQVGAGYDSLVATGTYTQDQSFFGGSTHKTGIVKVGDRVSLTSGTAEQLVTVVVAIHNWGSALTNVALTFTVTTTVGGAPATDTQDFSFPADTGPNSPSTTDVVFNFASQGAFVDHTFTYSISGLNGTSLNLALSNSYSDTAVGTDTTVGYLYVEATGSGWTGLGDDFPTCSVPVALTAFDHVHTGCGPQSPTNPGAYGTVTEVRTTGNADIPAIEVNVVGGIVPSLFPGDPAQPIRFAIVNKGPSKAHVTSVATTIASVTTLGSTSNTTCTPGWYQITGSPATYAGTVPVGTTLFLTGGTSIQLSTTGTNQDNCEGAKVHLTFASSSS